MKSLRNLLVAGALGVALSVGCGGQRQDAETTERAKLIEQVKNGMKSDYLDHYSLRVDGKFISAFTYKNSEFRLKYDIVGDRASDNIEVTVSPDSKIELRCYLDKIEDPRLNSYALKFGDKVLRGILLEQEKERKSNSSMALVGLGLGWFQHLLVWAEAHGRSPCLPT